MKRNQIRILMKYWAGCLILFAIGCGKESKFEGMEGFSQVYMPQAYDQTNVKALTISSTPDTIYFGAAFGGVDYPKEDIICQFGIAKELVAAYNEFNDSEYELLPESSYSVEELQATIKKGETSSNTLKLLVNTDDSNFDSKKKYMLPVELTHIDGSYPINEERRLTYFIIEASYEILSKEQWEVIDFSAEEPVAEGPNNGRAIFAIDGNTSSFWHTTYHGAHPAHPHFIIVDLGESQALHGLNIFGDSWVAGRPLEIEVLISEDQDQWQSAGEFLLDGLVIKNTIDFVDNGQKTYQGSFIKIVVNRSVDNTNHTCIAEIEAF